MQQLNNDKEKKGKILTVKKLPKILKKQYTEKKLNKKLLKKIYIPEERDFVKSFFEEAGKTKKGVAVFAIPKDKIFEKNVYAKLKKIAKEVSKQKGRFRLGPLIAVFVFLALIVVFSLFFKNKVLKSVIINAVQNSTEARCDIEDLDLSLFNARFYLSGFQMADKNDPSKNTIAIEKIDFDFDLLELLKSKFVANEVSVNGFELNSPRTTSGSLTSKELEKIHKAKEKKAQKKLEAEEKAKQKEQKEDSDLVKMIKKKSSESVNIVQNSLSDIFAPYNPETMFINLYSALKTPNVAYKIQDQIEDYVKTYSTYPQELEADVQKAIDVVESLKTINIEEIKQNPVKIKDTIQILAKAYETINELKVETELKTKQVQKDFDSTVILSKEIQNAVTSDTKYVKSEVNKITSLTLDDGMQFISGSFDTILCQLLGKYYPYYQKGLDFVERVKKNKAEKKPKKKFTASKRSPGRTVYYKVDTNPKFWLKKVSASGGDFEFEVLNITNDMDLIKKAATGFAKVRFGGILHNADFVVDMRSETENPLVKAEYSCDGLQVSYPSSKFGSVPGVPGLDSSKAKVGFGLDVYKQSGFGLIGKANLTDVKLSALSFEPVFISDIYSNVLAGINKMDADFNIGYTEEQGLKLSMTSDIDKIFMASLKTEITKQLEIIKKQAEAEVIAKINEVTNGALGQIQSFTDIKKQIEEYKNALNNISAEVEKKLNEAQNILKNTVDAAEQALKDAKDEAVKQIEAEAKRQEEELKRQLAEEERKAKEELAKKQKELEAEAERKRKELEAEAEKKKKELEAQAKKKAEEEAKKLLKKLF